MTHNLNNIHLLRTPRLGQVFGVVCLFLFEWFKMRGNYVCVCLFVWHAVFSVCFLFILVWLFEVLVALQRFIRFLSNLANSQIPQPRNLLIPLGWHSGNGGRIPPASTSSQNKACEHQRGLVRIILFFGEGPSKCNTFKSPFSYWA